MKTGKSFPSRRISELTLKRAQRPWLFPDTIFYLTDMGKRYKRCLSILHGFTKKVIRERQELRESLKGRPQSSARDDDVGEYSTPPLLRG